MIVAEISCNHAGKLDAAVKLVLAAKYNGADAVKFQCYSKELMAVSDWTIEDGPWAGRKASELYERIWTPWEWLPQLFQRARDLDILPFVSVFDLPALEFCERELPCSMYKISSFEINDTRLLEHVARTRKRMVISTGMALQAEIEAAVDTVMSAAPRTDLTLLHCVSAYPAAIRDMNLATISHMRKRWRQCKIGLSDHSPGHIAPVVATALGATMIEKHLKLDGVRSEDEAFSLAPLQFKEMADAVRQARFSWGEPTYGPTGEQAQHKDLRRCLHWASTMSGGAVIAERDLVSSRGPHGIQVRNIDRLVGKHLAIDVNRGEPVLWRQVVEKATEKPRVAVS